MKKEYLKPNINILVYETHSIIANDILSGGDQLGDNIVHDDWE